MKLSIIIVNFNTKEVTQKCIDSIYKARIKISFEVILVDNNSKDGSVEQFLKLKRKNFKTILNQENLGFAKANNQGLLASTGDYKLLLNSDTEVLPDQIEKMLAFASEHKNAGIIAPKLLNKDRTVQASVFRLPSYYRVIKQYLLNGGPILDKYYPETKTYQEVECVVAAAMLITPIGFSKVGMMNEKYFMYFEDFDYCRSMKKYRLKIYYLATSTIVHLHGESGKKLAQNKDQWKRLIPSSKIYHGLLGHYLINLIIWLSQKIKK